MNSESIVQSEKVNPVITVLMSVYNGEQYLRKAIDSILGQTFSDFEFIIVNDASTDGSYDILCSYQDPRIRIVVNDENIGLTRSLNKGLELARGEYVARQDADDISYPDRLLHQVRYMRDNPKVAVLGTQVDYINVDGKKIKVFAPPQPTTSLAARYLLMFTVPVIHPTVLFRKQIVWDLFGGYNPEFLVGQDADLWCRLGKKHVLLNLSETLVVRRIHPLSVSYDSTHPRRGSHVRLWKKRLPEVMREILDNNGIRSEWGEWWVDIVSNQPYIGKRDSLEVCVAIDRLHTLFLEKFPEAREDTEIPKITANLMACVALYMVETDRLASVGVYCSACKNSFAIALLYLPKYLSLLVFGTKFKKLYKFLAHK